MIISVILLCAVDLKSIQKVDSAQIDTLGSVCGQVLQTKMLLSKAPSMNQEMREY